MGDPSVRDVRRSGGWIGAVAALLGLVLVGFLGGALIGFLWEEPRLVFAYLSGQTESVEWSAPAPDPEPELDPRDVAAPPPEARTAESVAKAPAKPAPAKPAAAEPEAAAEAAPPAKPAPAPVARPEAPPAAPKQTAAVPPGGRFAVQVGAFAESASAEGLVERLRSAGYSAYVAPAPSGAARWRVRVGPVPTRPEAEKLAEKLKRGEELSTWVLDESAS